MEMLKEARKYIPFQTFVLAQKYGHEISFTPRYHCELQPIEGLCGIVKNKVAQDFRPETTALDMRNKLLNNFMNVTSSQLISLWKKAISRGNDYLQDILGDLNDYSDEEETSDSGDSFISEYGAMNRKIYKLKFKIFLFFLRYIRRHWLEKGRKKL